MRLSDIRIKLCERVSHKDVAQGAPRSGPGGRLKAFCALTFDNTFVIRDVKLIDGNDGLFLAMPSRKLADHCARCGEKNHLRARYCNDCGQRLDENRYLRCQNGNGGPRLKLHADIAHPINADCRQAIEQEVVNAYYREVERSRQPGYMPPSLDGEDTEFLLDRDVAASASTLRLKPTGTGGSRGL